MKNKENKNLYEKLFSRNKIVKQVLLWYLFISLFGGILLWFPIFKIDGSKNVGFIDSLFISSSAFSDTGLSTVSISDTYNFFGQLIIMILIIIGGIGFFSMKVFLINIIFLKKIDNEEKQQVSNEMSIDKNFNESISIIKISIIAMISSIFVFGIVFGFLFATVEPVHLSETIDSNLKGNWLDSFWTGFFHANSSINNAGFDIFNGDVSLASYYGNYFIQFLTIILFIFGGIGFLVIYDVYLYFKNLYRGKKFKFSLFTKISSLSYLLVAFFGLFFSFSFEILNFLIEGENSFLGANDLGSPMQKTMAITFNTFSTRNAGFSTIDIKNFSPLTKINFSLLMFIGSGPGSTAGGIRTTTFFVLILYLYSKIKKRQTTDVFNRTIEKKTIIKATKILLFSLLLVFLSSSIVSITELAILKKEQSYLDIIFLLSSSFGTVGLSTFPLSELSQFSKVVIILVMFIGQFGAANAISLLNLGEIENKEKSLETSIYIKESINL